MEMVRQLDPAVERARERERYRRLRIVGGSIRRGRTIVEAFRTASDILDAAEARWGLTLGIEDLQDGRFPNIHVHTPLVVVGKEAPARGHKGSMKAMMLGASSRRFDRIAFSDHAAKLPINTKDWPEVADRIRGKRTSVATSDALGVYTFRLPFDQYQPVGERVQHPQVSEDAARISTVFAHPHDVMSFIDRLNPTLAGPIAEREAARPQMLEVRHDLERVVDAVRTLRAHILG